MKHVNAAGKKDWYVPDMFLPESTDTAPYQGHESVCVLNTGEEDAEVECTFYLSDREPITGTVIRAPAGRSVHVKINDLVTDRIPVGVPYSAAFHSSVPVVLQCTRVDTAQQNLALMSVIAFGE